MIRRETVDSVPEPDDQLSWLPSGPQFAAGETTAVGDRGRRNADPHELAAGDIYGDFLIRGELGRGAIGVVYLAEQISLRRSVALKVSPKAAGSVGKHEGSTLASLDHPSIVRVYSESVEAERDRRVLCMQYVPGLTLRQLMTALESRFEGDWTGRDLLGLLDEAIREPVVMDASSIQARAVVESCDRVETVCWLGSQLAAALDYAHRSGIVHGDIKPENIIVNQFGRPLLVDFNLAKNAIEIEPRSVGGTVPYMSPESLDQLIRTLQQKQQRDPTSTDPCGDSPNAELSDLYSLAIVLWETLCGRRPFATIDVDQDQPYAELLTHFSEPARDSEQLPFNLAMILRRAFHRDPAARFQSGKDFAAHLAGASHQTRAIEAPNRGTIGRWISRFPACWLIAAGVAPHLCASFLQITYNQAQVQTLQMLNAPERGSYLVVLVALNVVMYGICATVALRKLWLAIPPARGIDESNFVEPLETSRRRLLRLPGEVARLGATAWFAAALILPPFLQFFVAPLPTSEVLHLLISFLFACAIAVIYAYALMTAVIIVGYYPLLHGRVSDFRNHVIRELVPIERSWNRLAWLAGAVPLAAANLLVLTHSQASVSQGAVSETARMTQPNYAFPLLMVLLIIAGAAGFAVVGAAGRHMARVVERCLGGQRHFLG